MSEISETYHLRTTDMTLAASLLRAAGLSGVVFPPEGAWTCFIAEAAMCEAAESLAAVNTSVLVHFVSAEDSGWEFVVYDGPRKACAYSCAWDEEVAADDRELDLGFLEKLARSTGADWARVRDLVTIAPESIESIMDEGSPADAFAEAMGLSPHAWLSAESVGEIAMMPETAPGALLVDVE